MFDRGLYLTVQAIRRQLAAIPHDLYLVRILHHQTRKAFPGERLWTAAQLTHPAIVRFLRVRNREGCDIYLHPYAERRNPGYILVDLDQAAPAVIETMQRQGHEPCVVLQTSPGHLQAWVHVSATPLEPVVATEIGRQLAHTYGGDQASTDWRHLGRLAGFTNRKPQRCNWRGDAPWVKVLHAHAGLASQGAALREAAECRVGGHANLARPPRLPGSEPAPGDAVTHHLARSVPVAEAAHVYADWLHRLQVRERFPQPDWSIADAWIAKELLQRGTPAPQVAAVLRHGSPGFPRQHSRPEDYLRRTLAHAARKLQAIAFPRRDRLPHPSSRTGAPSC